MAKRRLLKRDIQYVAGELLTEVLILNMFVPGVDKEKTEVVIERILNMQDEYIRRAGNVDGKDNKALVKEYYQKLRVDLQTEVDAIAGEIGKLNKNSASV